MSAAAGAIDPGAPPAASGGADCLAGDGPGRWFHLRRCAARGGIGCCDSSPSRHESAHAALPGHPIIQSVGACEDWFWSYADHEFHGGPALAPPARALRRPAGARAARGGPAGLAGAPSMRPSGDPGGGGGGMVIDWGDGDCARTAAVLEPASALVVELAGVSEGDRVLDVACGTGNATIAAARRGAGVVGVDLSPALVGIARARVDEAGLTGVELLAGDAVDLPVEAGSFDVAISVFGVIFAPDAAAAVGGMLGAVRPGGTIAIASWAGRGPVHEAGSVLRSAFPRGADRLSFDWDQPARVRSSSSGPGPARSPSTSTTWFRAPSSGQWFARARGAPPRPALCPAPAHARALGGGAPGERRSAARPQRRSGAVPRPQPLRGHARRPLNRGQGGGRRGRGGGCAD